MTERALTDVRRRMRWKAALRWLHLWTGAVASLAILAAGLSGMALAFVSPLFAWETGALTPDPGSAHAARAPIDVLVRAAAAHHDGRFEPLGVLMPDSRLEVGAAAVYGVPTEAGADPPILLVGLDPAAAAVLGSFDLEASWTHTLLHFHADLLLGEVGAAVVAVVALLLAGLAISGLVLWWPARGAIRRTLRRDVRILVRRPSHFALHRTLGVLSAVAILVWGVSGAVWSKPDWFDPVLNEAWQDLPAAEAGRFETACEGRVGPSAAARTARRAVPDGAITTMSFAGGSFRHHRVAMTAPGALDPYAGDTVVWVHATCPDVYAVRHLSHADAGGVVAHLLPGLHSGRLFGAAGVPIVLLVGAATVAAGATGLVLWFRRYRPRARRRAE